MSEIVPPTVSEAYPEDPVRTEDRETLQRFTDRMDADGDHGLDTAILHPHAILDTALRRTQEMGLAGSDLSAVSAVMGLWADGFMAGQRAMAESVGINLDEEPGAEPDTGARSDV